MSVKENAQKLQMMMAEGKTLEAFEEMYDDNVKVVEMPTGEVRNGKDAQRQAIVGWFESVEENHGGGLNSLTVDEENGVSTVEVWFDITFKEGGRMKMEEVAVQQWRDGKIVEERFYYNMPGQ